MDATPNQRADARRRRSGSRAAVLPRRPRPENRRHRRPRIRTWRRRVLRSAAGAETRPVRPRRPGTRHRPAARVRDGIASTIGHNVASAREVDDVMQQAAAAGARIVKPAGETFWGGYSGYFQDPDGHVWEVVFNPAFVPAG
nr:VOC family protein [Burkholderia multivorans]